MPLPLGPVIGLAVRYGAVAAVSALAVRAAANKQEHKNASFESSFDQIHEGFHMFRTEDKGETQYHAHHGHVRAIWLGRHGVELDTRLLGRIRLRRVHKSKGE